MKSTSSARDVALEVWQAGVHAVRAEHLIETNVLLDEQALTVRDVRFSLDRVGRIAVVGAGKAAGYLAIALERKLDPIAAKHGLHGWVNVPANCVEPTRFIRLHAARPAGVNEPRPEGAEGAAKIRQLVAELDRADVCICLLTGGGSALLPAPVPGISLADKLAVTRGLSAAGANIQDLNRVRIALSSLKGGGLARACQAGSLLTLIISDVIGDPLDLIASGPTVMGEASTQDALALLRKYLRPADIPSTVRDYLAAHANTPSPANVHTPYQVEHRILANNATAVTASAEQARRFGLEVETVPAEPPDTMADAVGTRLVRLAAARRSAGPRCILWGGEPVVKLVAGATRGRGGRNQQLVLAAFGAWQDRHGRMPSNVCLLSGGTDGEDGPTDAAGALLDASVQQAALDRKLDHAHQLRNNDAYSFFEQARGLIKTGPTHTNVCDVRVAVIL